jgi:hypothetical protein
MCYFLLQSDFFWVKYKYLLFARAQYVNHTFGIAPKVLLRKVSKLSFEIGKKSSRKQYSVSDVFKKFSE